MKILHLILIFSCLSLQAQNEFKKKQLSGTGLNTPMSTTPASSGSSAFGSPLKLPSLAKPNTGFDKPNTFEIGKKESTIDLAKDNGYTNPHIEIIKQQNEKFKHVDLGSIILNGNFVIVKYRDSSSPDGDMVRIMHNREPVVFKVILEPDYEQVRIDLKIGENRLEFLALNEGSASPNTAEFEIIDETGKLVFANQWNLSTGETGEVLIMKEK